MRWADLRDDGVELVVEQTHRGSVLALHSLGGAVPAHACRLGFTPITADRYVRKDGRLTLAELSRVFPRAKACEVEPASIVRSPDPLRKLRMQMRNYYGPDVDVEHFRVAEPDPGTRIRARAMSRLLGIEPVFLQYTGTDPRLEFAGLALRSNGDRRTYVNVHAPFPLVGVLGHEALHVMRAEQPQLYADLVEHLRPLIDQAAFARYGRRLDAGAMRLDGRGMSAEQIREEAVADIVGDMLMDPAVWNAIDDRSLMERLLEWLQRFLQGLVDSLRRRRPAVDGCLGGQDLLTDVQSAATVVAKTLERWRDARRGVAKYPAPGTELAAAFRHVEPEVVATGGFENSAIRNADGVLKTVYRGEWGPLVEHPFDATRLVTPTFSASPDVASVYAMDPWEGGSDPGPRRVGAYHLDIRNPLQLGSNDEDVVDFGSLRLALMSNGAVSEAEVRQAFVELGGIRHFPAAELAKPPCDRDPAYHSPSPEDVNDVDYTDTYQVADSPRFVELARRAGFDGMVYMGVFTSSDQFHRPMEDAIEAGYDDLCSMAMEYRPFERAQVRSVFDVSFEPAFAGAAFKRAWHGSPHRFDQPSLARVGSGEGHQAYGWGLYLAQEQRVGAFYRDLMLRRVQPFRIGRECVSRDQVVAAAERQIGPGSGPAAGELVDMLVAGYSRCDLLKVRDGALADLLPHVEVIGLAQVRGAAVALGHVHGRTALSGEAAWGVDRAVRRLESALKDHADLDSAREAVLEAEREHVVACRIQLRQAEAVAGSVGKGAGEDAFERAQLWARDAGWDLRTAEATVALLADPQVLVFDLRPHRQEGYLYAAEVDDAAVLLDWDAPVGEQAAVGQRLSPADARLLIRAWEDAIGEAWEGSFWEQSGGSLYATLQDVHGSAQAASEALMQMGFAGLQYLDGDHRYTPERTGATRNFVIWDLTAVEAFKHQEAWEAAEPAVALQ